MSRENLEIARRVWEAYARGDTDFIVALADPGIEFVTTHFADWPEEEVYRGVEGLRRFFEQWLGVWETFEAGFDELLDAPGDRVLVLCWQSGTGRESGVPAKMEFAQILTFKEGWIVRADHFTDRNQALEAAGLSE